MSQNDFNIANQGFPATRADINSALQALVSNSAGDTEPATTYAYQLWYDSTADILKMRNANNDAWITIATIDQTTDAITDLVRATGVNASALIPSGTTGERDGTPSAGLMRFNSTEGFFEGYDGTEWGEIGGAGGALSNRNILINGNLAVNQRGVSIASVATGAYGEDRWKKTAGGMTQIIEEVNYLPSTVYTLSGTNVTTQQITSPASGNWTLPDIPVTARLIQLKVGDTATPFEHRSYGDELQRCQRYYLKTNLRSRFYAAGSHYNGSHSPFPSFMRATPTSAYVSNSYTNNVASVSINGVNDDGCIYTVQSSSAGDTYRSDLYAFDAEL